MLGPGHRTTCPRRRATLHRAVCGAALIHLSGITLGIGSGLPCAKPGAPGTVVSFDPNVRIWLWPPPEEAASR